MDGLRWLMLALILSSAAGCSGKRDASESSPPGDAGSAAPATEPAGDAPAGEPPAGGTARPDDWPTTAAEPPGFEAAEPPVPRIDAPPTTRAEPPRPSFAPPPVGAEPPAGEEPSVGEASEPPFPESAPGDPEPTIATRENANDDHVVRVHYATDRAPTMARAAVTWWHFLPTIGAAGVTLLAVAALVFLPKKYLSAALALTGLVGTLFLGQMALVRAQQLRRAADSGDRVYGNSRHEESGAPVLELGVCEVSIPPDHRVGRVESPAVLRLEFHEDPAKHVILKRVVRLQDDAFYDSLATTVGESDAKQAFVFVHGYNVGFDSAVKRTAQIAYDLKFDGAPICYSWPSHAGLSNYTQDETNVAWTVTQLERFLRDVSERSGARTVHLVAHSMGNRALVQAIERLALRGDGPKFGQVILAAPDVDTSEFRTRYAPALAELAKRVTLYASTNDRALIASTRVHGYTRAGLSGEHLVVVPGLDTIDVSPIDTSLIGHSYYGDNPLMIRDLVAVIHLGLPADGREWLQRTIAAPQAFYWAFRQELVPEGP